MALLPWPLHLLYHVCISGAGSYVWFPPRHPLSFAFYSRLSIHRLHYDSMIGPALLYPRVPQGVMTYEPHAQGRTLSPLFSFGLGLPFVFNSGFVYCFYICVGISSAFILGSRIFLQH